MRFGVIAAGGKRALIAEHDPFALAREFFPNAFKNAFTREPEPAREQAKDDIVFREVRAASLDRRLSHGHGQHHCRLDRKRDRRGRATGFLLVNDDGGFTHRQFSPRTAGNPPSSTRPRRRVSTGIQHGRGRQPQPTRRFPAANLRAKAFRQDRKIAFPGGGVDQRFAGGNAPSPADPAIPIIKSRTAQAPSLPIELVAHSVMICST